MRYLYCIFIIIKKISMLYFFLTERKYWEVLEVRRGLWRKGPIYHSLPVPETKCYVGEFEFLRESIFSLYLGECLLNALLTRMGRLPVERMMSDLKVDILPQLWRLDCLRLSIFSYLLLLGKLANWREYQSKEQGGCLTPGWLCIVAFCPVCT